MSITPPTPLVHMRYTGPVVVAKDRSPRDLIVLIELKAADLADLPVGHLDLGVVAEDNKHGPVYWFVKDKTLFPAEETI